MTQIPEYQRGHRDALKWAVTWLSERARSMNDPHARQVLHIAAFSLGEAKKQFKNVTDPER